MVCTRQTWRQNFRSSLLVFQYPETQAVVEPETKLFK